MNFLLLNPVTAVKRVPSKKLELYLAANEFPPLRDDSRNKRAKPSYSLVCSIPESLPSTWMEEDVDTLPVQQITTIRINELPYFDNQWVFFFWILLLLWKEYPRKSWNFTLGAMNFHLQVTIRGTNVPSLHIHSFVPFLKHCLQLEWKGMNFSGASRGSRASR